MEGHDKASAWIVAVAAFLSGLILGFVLPRPNPPAAYVEPAPVIAPEPEPVEDAEASAPTVVEGPLRYSTVGLDVEVRKQTGVFSWTAENLRSQAEECGTKKPSGYFGDLVAKFQGKELHTYRFVYPADGGSIDSEYQVWVMPNAVGYETLGQFREDFDACAAGAIYPQMVSPKWLVFISSCPGADFDDGMAQRCEATRSVVLPSLQLEM